MDVEGPVGGALCVRCLRRVSALSERGKVIGGAQKYRFEQWGDIVWWYGVYESHYKPHGSATRPLRAPRTHALRLHKPHLRCRDAPWQAASKMARVVSVDWNRWFTTLPEAVQKLLHEAPMQFGKHPDRYECTRNARGHTRPFDWDLDAPEFPWHLVKLAGMRLNEYTVKDARKALAPRSRSGQTGRSTTPAMPSGCTSGPTPSRSRSTSTMQRTHAWGCSIIIAHERPSASRTTRGRGTTRKWRLATTRL